MKYKIYFKNNCRFNKKERLLALISFIQSSELDHKSVKLKRVQIISSNFKHMKTE